MRILVFLSFISLFSVLIIRWMGFEFIPFGQSHHRLEIPEQGPASFQLHQVWDSGKAEFCVYRSVFTKYGIQRNFETDLVTIREGFDPLRQTKADDPTQTHLIPAFKMNRIRRIPTGIYAYSQALSVFVSRLDPGRLLKQAFTSSDGCGMSYAELRETQVGLRGDFFSYWEQGLHGTRVFPEKGLISYDQLILYLRSKDLKEFKQERVRLLDTVFKSYLKSMPIYDCQITHMGEVDLMISGRLLKSHQIQLHFGDQVEEMNFGNSPTQPLLRWKHHDGSEEILETLRYLYYWELIKPGDRERNI